jgi:uncharacterized protein (TIGR02285 family)
LALLSAAPAMAQDRVTWPVTDFPPAYVLSGPLAGTGMADIEIQYLTDHLSDFSHVTMVTAHSRSWAMLAEQDGICIAGAIKTSERTKFAVFSRVAFAIFGPQILINSQDTGRFARFLNAAGEVDLALLAADHSLRAARNASRPLGKALDDFAKANNVRALTISYQALAMLDSGRLDYALGYANEITYFRQTHPGAGNLTALKIAGMPRILYTQVACSDRPLGRRIVARIDEILGPHGEPPYFQIASRRWYDTQDFEELTSMARWP